MTKESLQEILNHPDINLIRKKLSGEGFKDAKIDKTLKEVSIVDILNGNKVDCEDVKAGKYYYCGSIITDVKDFEDYTWLWIETLKLFKSDNRRDKRHNNREPFAEFEEQKNVYVPHKVMIFAREKEK